MTALVIVALFGVLLVLFGAVIGAEFQDRMHEGQRRRLALQRREVNARWRALQHRGAAFELAVPGHNVIVPIAFDAEDSD
jgi:cell division protein FtsL